MDQKQVLVLTNAMTDEEIWQIRRSLSPEIGQQVDVRLNLVHVIPRLPTCYFNMPAIAILIERYYEEARTSLYQIGNVLNVDIANQWLISGKVRTEVLRLANRLGSSCILAGAQQIKDLQRSLFFKDISHCTLIRSFQQPNVTVL